MPAYVRAQLVNRVFRTQFTDLCYGYNAFWASDFRGEQPAGGPASAAVLPAVLAEAMNMTGEGEGA